MRYEPITGAYQVGAFLTGVLVFVCCWIYCVAEYGFIIGVCLGWLPSAIVAVIAGFLWPLLVLIGLVIYHYASKG